MIGQTVSHYRILDKLGEGGMGAVYLAEDTLLGRSVAVKFLTLERDGEKFRKRFLREARSASALSHPHIATIHDYGETADGQPFLVMELVRGQTLDQILQAGPLAAARAVEIAESVAEALAEAHRHSIIHRDIKPSNIIINERGTVKVLDFGLAKRLRDEQALAGRPESTTLIETQTSQHVVLGTPMYLSPEQAKGEPVDARSDLFSLGSVLYECVAGRPPFRGAGVMEIFAQVIQVNPPPPSHFNPEVPAALDRVALKALAKNPDERYQSADELLTELRAARASLARGADAPARTRRVARPAGTSPLSRALQTLPERLRRPRFFVPASLALLCLALALAWAWRVGPPRPHPKARERYDEGTRALRDGTYYKATKLLEDAVRIDGRFALAHARLAEAWTELDYTGRAMASMMTAQALVREQSGWLPRSASDDALYVEAIDATIRRDFPRAVKIYSEIASRSPGEPHVYVDLGRAYEKNEEVDKAIENYQKAAELDPRDAAASLRLGILHGRKQNPQAAESAFAQAEQIYRAIDNLEGTTEVYYQRGYLADALGKLTEARTLLQRARDIASNAGNKHQQIKALLALSTLSAKEGRTQEAKEQAAEALDLARADGVENLTTQGLINLGHAFLLRFEHDEAEGYFKQALAFAQRSQGRRSEALALLALARLYIQRERDTDEALGHLDRALDFFRKGGYGRETALALLLRGRAKLQQGDYDAALREFEQQLQLAKQLNDATQVANSHLLLGNTLADREMYPEALRHFKESYEINKSQGVLLNAGYGLLNQGDMLWRLGRYAEARAALAEVPSIAERLDSNYKLLLLARAQMIGAHLALSERRFAEAKEGAGRAVALAGTKYKRTLAEAKYALGAALALSGAKQEGLRMCDEAVEMAAQENDPRMLSNALLALAEAALESGDAQGALSAALKAQERFARGGQQESEWRARLIAGRAGQRLNRHGEAREMLARAEELLSGLQQKWGAEAFQSYLTRPDVRLYRDQLGEALAAVR